MLGWSTGRMIRAAALALLVVHVAAADAPAEIVRYEHGRLTVQATRMPLATLLDRIAAASGASIRGDVPARDVTVDLAAVTLSDGLTTILGAQSFMLTYGGDGTLRVIELLAAGPAASPSPLESPSPRPPLAEEEAQATILQRPVTVDGPLARALGTEHPAIGRLLYAVLQEPRASLRAAAREAALATFARDPEAEAAYLSTLLPVEDAALATILRGNAAPGAAEEWMATLAARAPSPALREKSTAILIAIQRLPR